MKKFEHDKADRPRGDRALITLLDERGNEGWEVVALEERSIFFKREITPEVEARKVDAQARRNGMHAHLWYDHDNQVYVGDVFEIHAESYPDCEETTLRHAKGFWRHADDKSACVSYPDSMNFTFTLDSVTCNTHGRKMVCIHENFLDRVSADA